LSFDVTACTKVDVEGCVLAGSRVIDVRSKLSSCTELAKIVPFLAKSTGLQRFSTGLVDAGGNTSICAEAARAACNALKMTCSDVIEISWTGDAVAIPFVSPATDSVTVTGDGDPLTADARVVVTCDVLPEMIRGPFVRALDLRAGGGHCLRGVKLRKIVPALEVIVFPGQIEETDDALCACLFRLRVVSARHCVKLRKIGQLSSQYCVSLGKLLLPDSVTEIGGASFAGTHLLKLDLSECSLATADVSFATRLEELRLPSTCEFVEFIGSSSLRSLVVGHLKNDESWRGTCSGRASTIHFQSHDARMPPSFRVCSEKATIFAEVGTLSGRFTRPWLGFGI
jgi:hypothetical protein